ncbi:MAG: DUF3795 domain-containing protein [Candidatus Adiutricales bacterium]
MKEQDLITYCGSYGGSCARWQGYYQFRELVSVLNEWVDAQGYQHWMPRETREFDYNEFKKGLEFFSKKDSWLVCHRCCKGGDGNPDCEIRKCCVELELEICFDCLDFPCEKVSENSELIERARQYKTLGRDEWLRKQIEKANQGFENHTKKYYQLNVSKDVPKA